VLADARSLAFLALTPMALVGALACHSRFFFLALDCLLPHCLLTNMRLCVRRLQVPCLHQATRERRQRRLQLLPRSMHRVTTAAHVLDTRLLPALSLHRCITCLWACSFHRRCSPLALFTLPLEYLHRNQSLAEQRLASSASPGVLELVTLTQ
jgi:hypothetical protein